MEFFFGICCYTFDDSIPQKFVTAYVIMLAISKRYQTGIKTFFGLTNSLTESFGVVVHNDFKFLSVFGTLGLEVTNTPGTPKVLSFKLTGHVFFSNLKIVCFKKKIVG